MTAIVITAAKRTAIGAFMGSLKDVSAVDLGVAAVSPILQGLNLEDVADVILGNVLQAGQGMNPARQVALKAGLPVKTPGQTSIASAAVDCRRWSMLFRGSSPATANFTLPVALRACLAHHFFSHKREEAIGSATQRWWIAS